MSTASTERRKFTRINFDARTELRQGDKTWPVELHDISLRGILVIPPKDWQIDSQSPFTAFIHLDDEKVITMKVRFAHQEEDHAGFECISIDIDSISLLKRLTELNLGDSQLLQRELSALSRDI
ncbi:PilZ domain-containing protein [Zooshikella harenae]|uniref:Cyclic diguanosine monophosphate-binding protein n=1 Tax=Zooshikella harenae TaxID=2827238 RepID=A0ABS5ZE63_9GAMM|nr:PilZ domain-containing protein [Zooshikella harenae]MBU2712280.1 PilZ domain-containing protein [Zooshikella harenae]